MKPSISFFRLIRSCTLFGLLLLPGYHLLLAQYAESIESGRPGQAFGPTTVGTGIIQVQSGFDFAGSDSPGQTNSEFRTNHFIRLGLSELFEINSLVEYKSLSVDTTGSPDKTGGFSPLYFGFTTHAVEGHGWIPDIALHAGLFIPTGADEFRVQDPAPQILMATSHSPADFMSLTTNWALAWDGSTTRPACKYVINLAFSLPRNIGLFVENYGTGSDGELSTWFDGGLAWLVNDNLQLDLFGGYGKNGEQKDLFISAGLSWRLPHKKRAPGPAFSKPEIL